MPAPAGSAVVTRKDEVSIGGYRFPILGPVRRMNISVPPNPITFGDATYKGQSQAMSEQVQSSNVGGSGTYIADSRVEFDVNWYSEAETRYNHAVTLPPLTTDMGKPAALTDEDVTGSITYRNEQYVVFANQVYRWQDTSSTWSTLEYTLPGTPTDMIVFNGVLYIATGAGFSTRNSAGVWSDDSLDAYLFAIWDGRLFRLVQNVGVWELYSLPPGGAWSTNLATISSDILPSQMIVYRDAAGATAIYLVTTSGLWTYDAGTARWNETDVRWPRTPYPSKATVFGDGKMYIATAGMDMRSVQSGSQFIVSAMGLDRQDGVPGEEIGRVSAVASDQNWVLALTVSGALEDEQDPYTAMFEPLQPHQWTASTGKTILRAWNSGWHRLWTATSVGAPGTVLTVGSAYDVPRIYWSSAGRMYYQPLDLGLFNPRQLTGHDFSTGPVEHVTSWFDYGVPTQDKIHGHLLVETLHCSATSTIEVYYSTNLDESWTLLDTVSSDGLHEYALGGPEGMQARYFRFKFVFTRAGSDTTTAPIMIYFASQFMRILPETPGFAVTINLRNRYQNRTPAQMEAELFAMSDWKITPNLIKFSYQDQLDGSAKTYFGRITRISGSAWAGEDLRGEGIYQVSFIAPYTQDSLVGV